MSITERNFGKMAMLLHNTDINPDTPPPKIIATPKVGRLSPFRMKLAQLAGEVPEPESQVPGTRCLPVCKSIRTGTPCRSSASPGRPF